MRVWHGTPDAPRTPLRVVPGEGVTLDIGTSPRGPGQSVWVDVRRRPAGDRGDAPAGDADGCAPAEPTGWAGTT